MITATQMVQEINIVATQSGNIVELQPVLVLGSSSGGGDMLKSENLSGLSDYPTARTNLGLDTTANQTDSADKRFVTDAEKTVIGNTSGTNTGDQDLSTYQLKPSEGPFVDGDKTKLDAMGSSTLDYKTDLVTSTVFDGIQKGLNNIYPVNAATDEAITINKGTYALNDVIVIERKGQGGVEILMGTDTIIRGKRDGDNRYRIKYPSSAVALWCRGLVGSNLEWTIVGELITGYTGAVTTSLYDEIEPSETKDVAVVGTGFSANMQDPIIAGNGVLNSWVYNSPTSVTLNITSSGSEGDFLDVTWDNGDVSTDTNSIQLTVASGVAVVLHTTSTSATWSPSNVAKSGSTLRWTVTGDDSGVYDANDPTIDLSGNTGTAIIIITSADDLAGWTTCRFTNLLLTYLDVTDWTACTDFYVFGSSGLSSIIGIGSIQSAATFTLGSNGLTTFGTTAFPNVTTLTCALNSLSSFDGSIFPNLTSLTINGNTPMTDMDLTSNTELLTLVASSLPSLTSITGLAGLVNLTKLNIAAGGHTTIDISTLVAVKEINVSTNHLSVSAVNNVILDRFNNGTLTGTRTLNYISQSPAAAPTATEYVTDDVLDAYNALVAAGWTITGLTPV